MPTATKPYNNYHGKYNINSVTDVKITSAFKYPSM